ncbi:hypothetical protein QBC39DRAFT_380128 [Podospora conica]|nr:hypothetical protein QBC39DRAFT_380128 [Schizothecium conicum]
MSFSLTSFNIKLEEGSIPEARCEGSDGTLRLSHLNLNDHIGNNFGKFDVTDKDFLFSARSVRLEYNHVLTAELDGDLGRLAIVGFPVDATALRPQALDLRSPSEPESDVRCMLCRDWPRNKDLESVKITITLDDLKSFTDRPRNAA